MLTMAHANPARLEGGVLYVDRKFHTGMQEYLKYLDVPLLTLNPLLPRERDASVMDLVALPERELGYRIVTVPVDAVGRPRPEAAPALEATVRESRLIYGSGLGTRPLAKRFGVPTVPVLEYNVKTTMVFASAGSAGRLRRSVQRARALRYYVQEMIPTMRQAVLLHCNGYPVFDESGWFNANRLLYLDSRMNDDLVVPQEQLEARLAQRRRPDARRPQLIFSGRFEPAKGALDVVQVAAQCHQRGLDFDLHLYGQGSQRPAMEQAVAQQGLAGKVTIHEPVPYPELMKITRGCDVFVCCHVQDDPSCTYLETFGCGLPIVGYGNAMFRGVARHSQAGIVTPLHQPKALAESLIELLRAPDRIDELSRRARSFAVDHSFEREYVRRTDSLRELYQQPARSMVA